MDWKKYALAALRWVGEKLVALWGWLKAFGNTVWDPPAVAYKRLFFVALAIFVAGGATFMFVNSWFYKPTVALFQSMDEGDVALPETPSTFLPEVVQPIPEIKPTVVCEDMSDTPHCVPAGAKVAAETVEVLPPPVAKPAAPKLHKKAKRKVRKAKVSYQDLYCAGFPC